MFYLPEFSGISFNFSYCCAVFRNGVFFMEGAVLLMFGMLVRDKNKNCQYLITT